MTVYASVEEYAAFVGVDPNAYTTAQRALITAGLASAQDTILDIIRTQGVDLTVIANQDVIGRATCAQYEYDDATGDSTGAAGVYSDVKIGSLSLSRGSSAQGAATLSRDASLISPKAVRILRGAGFLTSIVGSY